MLTLIIGIAIGLLVGWNLLPQPEWVATLYTKLVAKFTTTTDTDKTE